MSSVDAARVVRELRALDERSGGRRVAWTPCWAEERARLVDGLGAEVEGLEVEQDPAGNLHLTLPGALDGTVLVSSHLDCVPDGGWLDGCLGVLAGAEVLRAAARLPAAERRTLRLTDWADEEGRFGRSLLGSSAACGTLDVDAVRALRDPDGVTLADGLAACGVAVDELPRAAGRLGDVVAALELHIEQGPVLEAQGRALAAVEGCLGVRRSVVRFTGQAAHAGATPMSLRADPVAAASAFTLAAIEEAVVAGGLATVGAIRAHPGIPTAVAAVCEVSVDVRHAALDGLEALDRRLAELASRIADDEGCGVHADEVWSIDPLDFDPGLVQHLREASGGGAPLRSGPLHDSASLVQVGVPAAMLFVRTRGGISHSREEDAAEADLVAGVEAFGATALALVDDSG